MPYGRLQVVNDRLLSKFFRWCRRMEAQAPKNESSRLKSLHSYRILDTMPESSFDDIARLAAYICNASMAAISFVDRQRQWFKSKIGIAMDESSREIALCAHAILQRGVFVVEDTLEDSRFADNPLVTGSPHIRFYAAAPLITERGEALGTICVFDRTPRRLSMEQQQLLKALSRQVMINLELRRHILEQEHQKQILHEYQQKLRITNAELQEANLTDDVTGFHNTRFLHQFLDYYLLPDHIRKRTLSLVFFDLDDFKQSVDKYGHILGSKILREVAQTVHQRLEPLDYIIRYGGDEFVVILPNQDREKSLRKVKKMRQAIAQTAFLREDNVKLYLTASFGLASFPEDAGDKHRLLAEADRCLFRSKEKGKNTITTPENF